MICRCYTEDGYKIGITPTWFGEDLSSYLEFICDGCGQTYSLDVQRSVRPEPKEYCFCGTQFPVFRYIEEVKYVDVEE